MKLAGTFELYFSPYIKVEEQTVDKYLEVSGHEMLRELYTNEDKSMGELAFNYLHNHLQITSFWPCSVQHVETFKVWYLALSSAESIKKIMKGRWFLTVDSLLTVAVLMTGKFWSHQALTLSRGYPKDRRIVPYPLATLKCFYA